MMSTQPQYYTHATQPIQTSAHRSNYMTCNYPLPRNNAQRIADNTSTTAEQQARQMAYEISQDRKTIARIAKVFEAAY